MTDPETPLIRGSLESHVSSPTLLLGTHEPRWLGRSPLPLFVSRRRELWRWPRRTVPVAWALDSGGFTELARGGWSITPKAYVEAVRERADRVPGMIWAAPQDWMCEPSALAATGLTVAEHQRRTVANLCELRQLAPEVAWVPVLQGWAPGDHERCAELYAAAGVALDAEPLVGVGTICRRQGTAEIAGIVHALAAGGLRLHGFGVKITGLRRYAAALTSADSLAWSYRARSATLHGEPKPGMGCTHADCRNCYVWAHQWHDHAATLTGAGKLIASATARNRDGSSCA